MVLDCSARCQESIEFNKGGCRAASFADSTLKDAVFVLKPKCAHAVHVIDGEEKVDWIEWLSELPSALCQGEGHKGLGASRCLPALRVLAHDDAASPAVGLGVGYGAVEY